MNDDCDVRWPANLLLTPYHSCAEHQPGHETHVCCCGAIFEEAFRG